ncbi:hypothetical protein [Paenibacillus sp. NPDC055715]
MKNDSLSNHLHSDPDSIQPNPSDSNILNCMMDFHKLAQYQIKLAQIMRNHHQFHNCLVLCDRAMFSMAKAVYIHRYQIILSSINLSITDLLTLIHTDTEPNLDMVLFIGTVHYLISAEDNAYNKPMKLEEVDRLLFRTDHILIRLSRRIIADPAERYPSIFI